MNTFRCPECGGRGYVPDGPTTTKDCTFCCASGHVGGQPYGYTDAHPHPDGGTCAVALVLAVDTDGSVFRVPDGCPECGVSFTEADRTRIAEAAEAQLAHERQDWLDYQTSMRGVNPDFRDL